MDHHCIWIGTCVGFLNQKFYWQLLFYSFLCLAIIFVTVVFTAGFTILSVCAAVALLDLTFLFVYQTLRIAENYTIEEQAKIQGKYNIFRKRTKMENWEQVFSKSKVMWFVPWGTCDVRQSLDYDAECKVGGVLEPRRDPH